MPEEDVCVAVPVENDHDSSSEHPGNIHSGHINGRHDPQGRFSDTHHVSGHPPITDVRMGDSSRRSTPLRPPDTKDVWVNMYQWAVETYINCSWARITSREMDSPTLFPTCAPPSIPIKSICAEADARFLGYEYPDFRDVAR